MNTPLVRGLLGMTMSLCCAGADAASDASARLNSPYAARYAASADLREFIDQRAVLPAEGSYFYGCLARWECHGRHRATRREGGLDR